MSQSTTQTTLTHAAETNTAHNVNVMFDDRDDRGDNMTDTITEWAEELAENVEEATTSEEFKQYLDTASQFHTYSWKNQRLIQQQKPGATLVTGSSTWYNEHGRKLKKGSKAIWIWRPIITEKCPKCGNAEKYHNIEGCDYDEEPPEEWSRGVVTCVPTDVYDISQTEPRDDVDDDEVTMDLDTSVSGGAEGLYERVIEIHESLGFPEPEVVPSEEWGRGAMAVCNIETKQVRAEEQSDKAYTMVNILHEYAHGMLHEERDIDESAEETEAEAVAYMVGRYFGLDVSNMALYLASWIGDNPETVMEQLKWISETSKELIEAIENRQ